jgi:hypothetical protein
MYSQYKMNFLSGLAIFGFSLVIIFFLIPEYVSVATFTELSPRFFPMLAALMTAGLSFCLIVTSLNSLYRHEKWAGLADLFIPRVTTIPKPEPFLCMAIIAAYIVLFEHIGFLIATPPVVALLMLVFGQRRPVRIAAISLILTGIIFALFTYGLKVPLQ